MKPRAETEPPFRAFERELDQLLAVAMPRLAASGVQAHDASSREYHYKNELLVWAYRFDTSWPVGSERAQITVRLQFAEFDGPREQSKVELRTVAEVFQVGQLSRLRKQDWRVVPLERLSVDGIDATVLEEIASAIKLLEASGIAPPPG